VRAAAALAGTWTVTSLLATWWAYDRTPLYEWRWLAALVPPPVRRYAVVSAGLDEVSPALRRLYPAAEATLLDLYEGGTGSIRRARTAYPPPAGTRQADPDHLPVPGGVLDAVFAVFAAHELHTAPRRRALYREIARILRPGGRLVLVEHCRDAANVLAYGPGAWHFYPRAEWLRLGRHAGLEPVAQRTMTPLVRAIAMERGDAAPPVRIRYRR
jgi:SAM-dependent methyltransferase